MKLWYRCFRTLELPRVYELWFWMYKGMHHVKHLMVVDYYWCQLAQWLGLDVPDYRKKEGATPLLGMRKQSLQYDGRPDWGEGWNVV